MFKLTRKVEYALIALRHMQDKGDALTTSRKIAELYFIPQEQMAKILQKMTKLNYLEAVQGPQGGYRVHKVLDDVNLTRFLEDMEGPVGIVECNISRDCTQLDICNIRLPIKKINENIRSIFSGISLSEITH